MSVFPPSEDKAEVDAHLQRKLKRAIEAKKRADLRALMSVEVHERAASIHDQYARLLRRYGIRDKVGRVELRAALAEERAELARMRAEEQTADNGNGRAGIVETE